VRLFSVSTELETNQIKASWKLTERHHSLGSSKQTSRELFLWIGFRATRRWPFWWEGYL